MAVDKTGTLTKGRPRLTDVVVLVPSMDRAQVLTWAARAEAGSEHPLACPILVAAAAEDLPFAPAGSPGLSEVAGECLEAGIEAEGEDHSGEGVGGELADAVHPEGCGQGASFQDQQEAEDDRQ